MNSMNQTLSRPARIILFCGACLFTLGLIAGLATGAFKNPRMALSAHLEGILNGMYMMLVALLWSRLSWSASAERIARWSLLWGAFVNFAACVLAAAWGTSRMTPIAGHGHSGSALHEWLVSALFVSVGVSMLVHAGIFTWALRPQAKLTA
ncbi:MAG TPA: hypothetical protein PLZ57_07880 [Pseudobdellovibrionaceae bacterium]|nr:hypothetical protein [Pseudobdellovibrionaceae bacterium]